MTLGDELTLYGSAVSVSDFEDMLQEVHAVSHPQWTTEQLLYHPDDSKIFCNCIRARAGIGLPDEMILRRLQNIRKRGQGKDDAQ